MTDDQRVFAMVLNCLKQFVADQVKRPSLSALELYNSLVAHANALHSSGVLDAGYGPDGAWTAIYIQLQASGFPDTAALVVAHEEDWLSTWPVPLATS